MFMILDDKLMKYVLFKRRTKKEVKDKCKLLGFTDDYADEVIAYLEENGYLDDEKYVMKYILNVIKLKKCSIQEIKFDLMRRGIKEELIEKYITEDLYSYELDSAMHLAKKKYKDCKDILKVRKYLSGKGYSREIINKAIDYLTEISDNSIEIY